MDSFAMRNMDLVHRSLATVARRDLHNAVVLHRAIFDRGLTHAKLECENLKLLTGHIATLTSERDQKIADIMVKSVDSHNVVADVQPGANTRLLEKRAERGQRQKCRYRIGQRLFTASVTRLDKKGRLYLYLYHD